MGYVVIWNITLVLCAQGYIISSIASITSKNITVCNLYLCIDYILFYAMCANILLYTRNTLYASIIHKWLTYPGSLSYIHIPCMYYALHAQYINTVCTFIKIICYYITIRVYHSVHVRPLIQLNVVASLIHIYTLYYDCKPCIVYNNCIP